MGRGRTITSVLVAPPARGSSMTRTTLSRVSAGTDPGEQMETAAEAKTSTQWSVWGMRQIDTEHRTHINAHIHAQTSLSERTNAISVE